MGIQKTISLAKLRRKQIKYKIGYQAIRTDYFSKKSMGVNVSNFEDGVTHGMIMENVALDKNGNRLHPNRYYISKKVAEKYPIEPTFKTGKYKGQDCPRYIVPLVAMKMVVDYNDDDKPKTNKLF